MTGEQRGWRAWCSEVRRRLQQPERLLQPGDTSGIRHAIPSQRQRQSQRRHQKQNPSPKRLQLTILQAHCPRGHGHRLLLIVRHQQSGHTGSGDMLTELVAQALAQLGVQS